MDVFTVEYGVHGAMRISTREFETQAEAFGFARRWSRSNSTGHYWAEVTEGDTVLVRFNLPRPR